MEPKKYWKMISSKIYRPWSVDLWVSSVETPQQWVPWNNEGGKSGFRLISVNLFIHYDDFGTAHVRPVVLASTNDPCQKAASQEFLDLNRALLQISTISHFRQQPSFTVPLNSSNSQMWKRWVPIWGLSRPLSPVILTPCSRQHDIPDLRGPLWSNPLETHFFLLSFLRPPSLLRSFLCFRVRASEEGMKGEGGRRGDMETEEGCVVTLPEYWLLSSFLALFSYFSPVF